MATIEELRASATAVSDIEDWQLQYLTDHERDEFRRIVSALPFLLDGFEVGQRAAYLCRVTADFATENPAMLEGEAEWDVRSYFGRQGGSHRGPVRAIL